ncbi:MAG: AsnC family protein [Nocardioides sp.]|uniref:AsnC family protein n=1 Tax=Nocardioides sp. TaxID=35761 RepID=UPI0039E4D74A
MNSDTVVSVDAVDRRLLALLATGARRGSLAGAVGLSAYQTGRRVRRLRALFSARTDIELVVKAVRSGAL